MERFRPRKEKQYKYGILKYACFRSTQAMGLRVLGHRPTAPWYGGREWSVVSMKLYEKACVRYEEMLTLLCEAESVINGRPFTYLSDDPNEITPAHFIQDIRGSETHDIDIFNSKHLLKRVRYLQSLRENLRKRFQKDNLGELVRNPNSRSKQKEISAGKIALIGCESTKRLNWPLGCVVLFPCKDAIRRVAKLRVANSYLVRPLQGLYPLEMSVSEFPSDTTANEKDKHFDVHSGDFMSSTTPIQRPLNPKAETFIPMTEVSQPVKLTRRGRKLVPRQRFDL
ncbi:uncharacterized protein [Parasteatoda tepidariorum]|uniref:uncharacterized protein n=1 Tax=Parasteatoda tepidariorum TaxID=114398 RepID=UPI0039BCCB3B